MFGYRLNSEMPAFRCDFQNQIEYFPFVAPYIYAIALWRNALYDLFRQNIIAVIFVERDGAALQNFFKSFYHQIILVSFYFLLCIG